MYRVQQRMDAIARHMRALQGQPRLRTTRVSYAWPLAVCAAWPVARWVRHLRRVRLLRRGICPACGYDIRVTTERCPECGTAWHNPVRHHVVMPRFGPLAVVGGAGLA